MSRRYFTAEEDAYLVAHYGTMTHVDMAAHLGRTRQSVQGRMERLYREGRAEKGARFYNRPWKPEELAWLRKQLGRGGCSLSVAAQRLNRSRHAVICQMKEMGVVNPVHSGAKGTLGKREIERAMGLGRTHPAVRRWIREGLLKAGRVPFDGAKERGTWFVRPADFIEFLQRHPHAYDRARMPTTLTGKPNPWLTYVPRVSGPTAGYLTPKQAARLIGMAAETVRTHIRRGRLPAVRLDAPGIHPGEWWVKREDAEAFRRSRERPASFKDHVYQAFVEMRIDFYQPVRREVKQEIADGLGVPVSTVKHWLTAIKREALPVVAGAVGASLAELGVRPGNVAGKRQVKRAAASLHLSEQTALAAYAALWPTMNNLRGRNAAQGGG